MAAEVFAICINDTIPSCILAPPEQQNRMTGRPWRVASSNERVIFSPTTFPILDIMKRQSQTPKATDIPFMVHLPVTTASLSPVFS